MFKISQSKRCFPLVLHNTRLLMIDREWSRKNSSVVGHPLVNMASETSMNEDTDYSQWSSEKLIERVTLLETRLRDQTTRLDFTLHIFFLFKLVAEPTDRCNELLHNVKSSSPIPKSRKPKNTRQFDPSKYSTRFIALKFAYLGQRYNGLEYHANNATPFATIEEELWKAFYKAKLIFPTPNSSLTEGEPNWEGCDYSKCGRTDKGVSAFDQVISLKVRSNRPLIKSEPEETYEEGDLEREAQNVESDRRREASETQFNPIKDELPYPQILNRLLPPEIRVLAWCPFPPVNFSARFSCTERCYKYYFTQPAFAPTVDMQGLSRIDDPHSQRREGWLDIQAMREAARKFEGSHDFRNFCKVDPSKQINIFTREINNSDVVEMKSDENGPAAYIKCPEFHEHVFARTRSGGDGTLPGGSHNVAQPEVHSAPKIYAFQIRGSGFLWHQVRHMVAILFLIGQGLEKPSLIDHLLDIENTPQKPVYDMADPEPLVLEACKFGPELQWVFLDDYSGNEAGIIRTGSKGDGKHGIGGAVDELWKVWHRHKIDETLAGSLLNLTAQGHKGEVDSDDRTLEEVEEKAQGKAGKSASQKVFLGGGSPRVVGKYIPVLERLRMESVDVINAKYLKRKGLDPPERHVVKSTSME